MKTLPHQSQIPFLSDGGLETTLFFIEGVTLPGFAAFPLLRMPGGRERLRAYFKRYIRLAHDHEAGFILESPKWRANPRWAQEIGWSLEDLDDVNREAIGLMHELREEFETPKTPMLVSGCIGPHGDGYVPTDLLSAEEAERYHGRQVRIFRDAGADLVTAMTLNYPEEAIGVARAAAAAEIPSVISFTVETNGSLPTGHTLGDAINIVDAESDTAPIYYMINCAHPTHFADAFPDEADWLGRIGGIRANASKCSHAELDACTELDEGDPQALAQDYRRLQKRLPNLRVLGGCCGTDHRHVASIARACLPYHAPASTPTPAAA